MAVHDKLAKFWFTFGIIILLLGIIIMQVILIFIGLLFIGIGIWYWLRDPHEPKCSKCGFVNREGAKTCPSCNAEIKKNHQIRNLALGAIIGLGIAGLFMAWIFHLACTDLGRCLW
jgi:hypothetical protein